MSAAPCTRPVSPGLEHALAATEQGLAALHETGDTADGAWTRWQATCAAATHEVFRHYLKEGKPGFVEHRWAGLGEAVRWKHAVVHRWRYALPPDAVRGRVVGNVMSGLMLGIMMARPVASVIAHLFSWHTMFYLSAVVMVALAALLWTRLPRRAPVAKLSYLQLIGSMGRLLATQPVLQRRAAYQAFQFAAFSLFWTVTPLYLSGPAFGLSQGGIALFALAGVAGAIASPIAGRLADRGLVRPATAFGLASVAVAFLITHIAAEGSSLALALLTFAAILLDFGVTMTLVTGQRSIYELGADLRSRLNGLFMAIFFTGGAIGSALGAWAFASGAWSLASMIGLALPVLALAVFATEKRKG